MAETIGYRRWASALLHDWRLQWLQKDIELVIGIQTRVESDIYWRKNHWEASEQVNSRTNGESYEYAEEKQ